MKSYAFALARCGATASLVAFAASAGAQGLLPLERDYDVAVVAEAVDQLSIIRFGPAGARVLRTMEVGMNPLEPDGPHGIAFSPSGADVFVTTAHGTPYGHLWKLDPVTGASRGNLELGDFPATLQISPDGLFAYVVNFNLHGEMVPSTVSVVSTSPFIEVARIRTCAMPHGSRLSPDGSKHYSACMMDEMLVEIDTRTLTVARHFMLTRGSEHGMAGVPRRHGAMGAAGDGGHGGHGMDPAPAGDPTCSPTWAQPSADGRSIFVACNRSNDIVEVDAERWALKRRIAAGDGVYNLATTRDGRLLVATNKRGQSVSVIELPSGRELARIPTKRKVVHGVAISNDDRYAFVTVEGIGSEPGTVEMIDLRALKTVATVDVGQMVGGIDTVPEGRR